MPKPIVSLKVCRLAEGMQPTEWQSPLAITYAGRYSRAMCGRARLSFDVSENKRRWFVPVDNFDDRSDEHRS